MRSSSNSSVTSRTSVQYNNQIPNQPDALSWVRIGLGFGIDKRAKRRPRDNCFPQPQSSYCRFSFSTLLFTHNNALPLSHYNMKTKTSAKRWIFQCCKILKFRILFDFLCLPTSDCSIFIVLFACQSSCPYLTLLRFIDEKIFLMISSPLRYQIASISVEEKN